MEFDKLEFGEQIYTAPKPPCVRGGGPPNGGSEGLSIPQSRCSRDSSLYTREPSALPCRRNMLKFCTGGYNMLFFLVFGILMLLPGLFFAVLTIRSINPNNLITITGELTKKRDFKNYKLKSRSVPNAVKYTYTYIVNGKSYSLRGVQLTHSRNLYKRIAIVYLRGFPRCAYTEHFSGIQEWLIAISFTAMGTILLLLYFCVG